MEAPKCGKCKSNTIWLPEFQENVTQAVPVMHYSEDDAWEVVEDVTYPIWYSVSRCTNPECGELFLYDTLGGLGTMTPRDYEERSGHKLPPLA